MNTQIHKTGKNGSRAAAPKNPDAPASSLRITDNRPEAVAQRKQQELANESPQVKQLDAYHEMTNQNKGTVQRMKFGKEERFKPTFTSSTGLTGHILGESPKPKSTGTSSAPVQEAVPEEAVAVHEEAVPDPAQMLAEARQRLAEEHSWDGHTLRTIGVDETWVNANMSGVAGSAGMTGKQGAAIWLSIGDGVAQSSYGGKSQKVHEYRPKRPLRVAVLTQNMQVFPPDDRDWVRLFPDIDGAWTNHGAGRFELAVFDANNLAFVQTRDL